MLAEHEECVDGEFVPMSVEQLREKACEAAQVINNDPKLLASFFHHAKLAL